MSPKNSPLSGNPLVKHFEVKDYLISHQNFGLYFDKDWDMLMTFPAPENLDKYYHSKDYKPHKLNRRSLLDKLYNFIRNRNFKYKYRIIKQFNPKAQSILDYGTATGEFLAYLSDKNFNVSGIEPDKKARETANELLQNKVKNTIDDVEGKYDVITLWHVLEHIPDLDDTIEKLLNRLEQNGILLIAVPNFKSYDAQHYGTHWAAYDVPRHLWHFSPNAITELFSKHHCRVVAQKPLFFDSFYVSLLSEQYKTGKKRLIPAFMTGLKSNFKAQKNGQYSSLIYAIIPNAK